MKFSRGNRDRSGDPVGNLKDYYYDVQAKTAKINKKSIIINQKVRQNNYSVSAKNGVYTNQEADELIGESLQEAQVAK